MYTDTPQSRHIITLNTTDGGTFTIRFSDEAGMFYWQVDNGAFYGGNATETAEALRQYITTQPYEYSIGEIEYAATMIQYEEQQYVNANTP